jgi:methyl-accepting chemotaxis protein
VNTAITQMDQVTQQNAALVEQAAAVAESMQEQAQQLVQVVAVFKLANDGQASVARASANVTRLPVKAAAKPAALAAPKGKKVSGGDAESAEWEEF